jgi:hypothetical protein
MFNKLIKRLEVDEHGHFHSPVEHSVEKQENAGLAFDKQKGFNGLHYRSHVRWNLKIAQKSGIDKNDATV